MTIEVKVFGDLEKALRLLKKRCNEKDCTEN